MISIVFGLGTALCFATSSLFSSRAVRIIGPWSVAAWTMIVGLVLSLPFVALAGVPANLGENVGWMLIAGAGNVGGLILAAAAFRVGKVGVVTPVLATEGAIAAVVAALMGESIAPIIALLLMVIVIGIVVSAIAPDPEPLDHERPVLAVALSTIGAFAFGFSLFATGTISDELPIAWVLMPARIVGLVALAIPLIVIGQLKITRRAAPMVTAMGVLEVVGFVLFAIGAQYQVGVTSVMASQFAPIAAILAYVVFREKLGRLQITGVAILVAGVTTLTLVS
ncbi:MAG: DMT family transporter [Candidatus Nanopelagicales bacterium]|nr:DMT family transporter [Candidatus Nanopelagicales bacterium]MCF8536763.1 DMT family transporter [Candidatus Nanopelagicales bacterium]MCF8542219.1 DMT family transporter [Candidatus Nanopelagicales bacterium]MCF8557563.1 DMT family transporter [Candidatus Nanopelagicales bacterium]